MLCVNNYSLFIIFQSWTTNGSGYSVGSLISWLLRVNVAYKKLESTSGEYDSALYILPTEAEDIKY